VDGFFGVVFSTRPRMWFMHGCRIIVKFPWLMLAVGNTTRAAGSTRLTKTDLAGRAAVWPASCIIPSMGFGPLSSSNARETSIKQ